MKLPDLTMQSKLQSDWKVGLAHLLKQTHVKPNTHFEQLIAYLKEQKLVYTVDDIKPEFFLTHKANRGGLLLSPHNAHRNGARIKNAGADLNSSPMHTALSSLAVA